VVEQLTLMIKEGADVNEECGQQNKMTPLATAVYRMMPGIVFIYDNELVITHLCTEAVELLLEHNANPHWTTQNGKSMLSWLQPIAAADDVKCKRIIE
jgi:hypothetical protein